MTKKEGLQWRRTHNCGELRTAHVSQHVMLNGWVANRRDFGDLIFLVLRDRYGKTQLVINRELVPKIYEMAKDFRQEFVLGVKGKVIARPHDMINQAMSTGEIEVSVEDLILFNKSETLPFPISENIEASETLRLKYRYLDLRRDSIQRNILGRSRLSQIVRETMCAHDFIDIETPFLYKSTPEGAREFLVPSRIHPGQFYALPQSPQLFKQLLMIAGYDRYYQLVKCFRDEDFRADRQPEFTQIDCEMSFVEEADVRLMFTDIVINIVNKFYGRKILEQIPIMTFAQAMEEYGCDKPDLRFELKLIDLSATVKPTSFKLFQDAMASGGIVNAIVVKGASEWSRKKIEELSLLAKQSQASSLLWIKKGSAKGSLGWQSSLTKSFNDQEIGAIDRVLGAVEGDLILIQAGEYDSVKAGLSAVRNYLGKELKLYDPAHLEFVWIIEFPLLEKAQDADHYVARHHPFTSPKPEDLHLLQTHPLKVRAQAYDLVCNGYELGGGSIRIHDQELQRNLFKTIGMSQEDAEKKFGFLLEALKYGAPPHGGIAFGLDRLAMVLLGCDAIREIIPFPKTQRATCLLTEAPSPVPEKSLKDLHIKVDSSALADKG